MGPARPQGITIMNRNISGRSRARSLFIAAALGLGALTVCQPSRAFASFSSADRQEQGAATAPAAIAAAPAAPSAAAVAQQQRMASKQRAMQAAMARRQVEESRKAARRAFVGGVIVGILAAGRRR
jgi:hypothetical protein